MKTRTFLMLLVALLLPTNAHAQPPDDRIRGIIRYGANVDDLRSLRYAQANLYDLQSLGYLQRSDWGLFGTIDPGFLQWGMGDDTPRRPQFHEQDPADSLYRAAYGFFSRQEYRPAADRFSELRSRFATSRYLCDAAYYEAFARYRLGTPEELRTAYTVLQGSADRCTSPSSRRDVPELLARIDGALARVGDAAAAARLRTAASQGQSVCDREERSVKIAALSALAQMDPEAANPVLRGVLTTTDECSAPVRRQAIAMVARRDDAEAAALLGEVFRNDPERQNRLAVVEALGNMSNEAAIVALEAHLRDTTDERVQAAAAGVLGESENPRALTAVQSLIERNDVAERIRVSAISSLATNEAIPFDYWRGLYGRVESDELRRAVVGAIARNRSEQAQQFLLTLARNPSEPYEAREAAISRIRSTAPIAELYRLYETADTRTMRMSVVSGLSARRESEATDHLIEIAKTSTDPEVRAAAIRALGQNSRRQDPRVVRALTEIMGCCQP